MTRRVTFLDTSVLVEVLGVPNKAQRPDEVRDELRARVFRGEQLMLPTATIIETGNHIAQLPNGEARRRLAQKFKELLEGTMSSRAPWRLHSARWDIQLISAICDGGQAWPALTEMFTQGIGTGDVSILAEARAYRERVNHVDVRIWTLERGLKAYS